MSKKIIFTKNTATRVVSVIALAILAANIICSPASAAVLTVASSDDIYNKMLESAKLNVAMNAVKKCTAEHIKSTPRFNNHSRGISGGISSADAQKGDIYANQWSGSYSTARWHEMAIGAGDDGKYNCGEKSGENGILAVVATIMKKNPGGKVNSAADLVCKSDGSPGILAPYKVESLSLVEQSTNCIFDTSQTYGRASNWDDNLRSIYNDYKNASGNKFIVGYDEIGTYTAVDGYFNYIEDFDKVCETSAGSPATKDSKLPNVDYTEITEVKASDTKLVFKNRYYHVKENKSWSASLGSVEVNSCQKLIDRIHELALNSNYDDFDAETQSMLSTERNEGYYNVTTANFQNKCKDLKTLDDPDKSAWTDLREKLTALKDSEEATDEQKQKAEESLAKIPPDGSAASAYTELVPEGGSMDSEEGLTLQCLDIDELSLVLDEYESGAEDLGEQEKEPSCFDNTGALGWIVCPLIEGAAGLITAFYNNLIEPFLQIDVGIFAGTRTGGLGGEYQTHNGLFGTWQTFQVLANIVFVGVFIFIIFSQITGFGIDNYGIKKVLPKLIVGAIMINASFLICQLAVEVSNILGMGVKNIFLGLDTGINTLQVEGTNVESHISSDVSLALIIAIVVLLAKGGVLTLDKLAIPILLTFIIIIVSIFFLFAVLAIRQALVIMLVVISPLAFVCYMLPNTKKIFDRWFKLFQGALLAYPIASAMVFGGQAAGKIILSANTTGTSGSFAPALLFCSALMSIVPVFMIPSMITKSMGAIGALAANAGHRAKGFTKGAAGRGLEKSRLGQWSRDRGMDRDREKMLANARRTQHNLDKKRSRNEGNLSKADERRLVRAQGILAHDARENQEAYRTGLFGNMSQGNSFDDENTILGQFRGDDMFMEPNGKGKMELNADKAVAALDSIADADKLTAAYGVLSATSGFQEKMAGSAEFRSRVAGVLSAKGDPINKSIAKLVMAGGVETQGAGGKTTHSYSLSNMAQGGGKSQLASKIQGLGNSAMVGMDKDAFNTQISIGDGSTVSAASLFSDSQWASGMGQSGKALENYSAQIADMSSEQQSQILGNASINDIGNITPEAILAFGGYKPESGKTYADAAAEITANNGDLSKVSDEIRHAAEEGARKINESSTTAIEQIKTTSGDAARAGMNQIAAQMLQIKTDQRPVDVRVTIDHNGGTTSPSGGHAGPNSDPMDAPVG